MIHLVGYLQVYKPPRFFGPFLKTGLIFANLSGAGKMQISIMLLKFWYIKMEEISAFSLIMFVGTSFSCEALQTYKSFISFMTYSFVILLKVKTEIHLSFSFIAKILGWLRYIRIAFKVRSLTFSKFKSLWFVWVIFEDTLKTYH